MHVTIAQLAAALKHWDLEAKVQDWPDRTEGDRFIDSAEYLFNLIREMK
jgi:hypothetical protein